MQPAPPAAPALPALPDLPAPTLQPAAPDPGDPTVVPAPGTPTAVAGPVVARAVPRTAQELAGLREQRRELSSQITSAQSRRRDVAGALERARDPVNQNGLQQRLRVLDQRIAQLEVDLSETGRLITTASPALVGQLSRRERDPFGDRGPPAGAVATVFIVFAIFPLIVALGRGLRRRGVVTRPDPAQRETAERLARMEQAVEAIAIEVERVSEGQRFVTRLLAEQRQTPALAQSDPTFDVLSRQG